MKNNLCVQTTNDFSTLSKVSTASLDYFSDKFQKYFVSRTCRRAPLIHRGYYVRSQAVNLCIKEFLEDTQQCHHRQVLSLGCGFDALYFRLCAEHTPGELCVWEVDFPAVVQRKHLLIEQTEVLRNLLGSHEASPSSDGLVLSATNYRLLGVDLSDVSTLESALEKAGIMWDCPTLVLAEVVLCYMDPARSTALIEWVAKRFARSRFVLYEQITPNDPFGQVMMNHFLSLNSPLHSVTAFPSLQDQRERFLQQGWEQCRIIDMNEFTVTCISVAERIRVESLEPFDEFEELHLKCSHYFILVASRGSLAVRPVLRSVSDADVPIPPTPAVSGSLFVHSLLQTFNSVRRFGHRSCLTSSHHIITTGGFGEGDGKHKRLTNIHVLLYGKDTWDREQTFNQWDGRLHHSFTPLSNGGELLVLGGRLSPSHPAVGALVLKYDEEQQVIKVTHKEVQLEIFRWRHTAIEVFLCGQVYVFLFGGRTGSCMAMQDTLFLDPDSLNSIKISVLGNSPSCRHSHSCCGWNGGAVISGGLLRSGRPSGSVTLLKPYSSQFQWEKLNTTPPLTPRYSHTSHVINGKLVLVGGIWFVSNSVPGLAVIDLKTGHCAEYQINASVLEWPLMLHGHSSLLLPYRNHLLLLGGGGTCFSFGTHLNVQPVLLDLPPLQ
ncbi:tRNA wybutosine-synthesizing 4 [Pelobates cultripes]|uniref:tRNA wybutosine-synthesizing protein 4 n=1 Tax=Pelobates cultripes TaxID=61616 RepID=A0AAD1RB10_PELCU|nr:tRNA wybutosine-synthesizing 4 [Pelobates cultripes]